VFLVTAFDRNTGARRWEYELPAEGDLVAVHEKHNLASPSPVTDGERVYAWFATGQVVALDMSGALAWKKNLGTEYGPVVINWGHGSSPAVHHGQLVLLCYHDKTSYLLALEARTGAVRWKHDAPAGVTSYSTPLFVQADDRTEIVVNSSAGVSGHDFTTGERLWHFDEANRFPVPTPFAHEGVIYVSRGFRSSPFMAIRPGGSGELGADRIVWRVPSGAPYISSLVHHDGLLFMTGDVGVLAVHDARSGERVYQERIGGVYTACPVVADGKVYLVSEDGETIVVAAGRAPTILARNRLDARQLASPAVRAAACSSAPTTCCTQSGNDVTAVTIAAAAARRGDRGHLSGRPSASCAANRAAAGAPDSAGRSPGPGVHPARSASRAAPPIAARPPRLRPAGAPSRAR
jgi:outer membrane protein assembly factor BamB